MKHKNDLFVAFDGRDNLMTENAVFEHALQRKSPGDRVQIVYLRGGKHRTTHINLQ